MISVNCAHSTANIVIVRDSLFELYLTQLDTATLYRDSHPIKLITGPRIQMDTTYWGRNFGLMVFKDASPET